MNKYMVGARRAFLSLSLMAMFSLAAGGTTPAYATSTVEPWTAPFGDWIDGWAEDLTSTLQPDYQAYTLGNVTQSAPAQTLPKADLSAGAVVGGPASILFTPIGDGATSVARASVQNNFWGLLAGANDAVSPSLHVVGVATMSTWDTIYPTYPGGITPTFGAVVVSGVYGASGPTVGNVNLTLISLMPSTVGAGYTELSDDSQNFPVPTDSTGSFTDVLLFPTDATIVELQVTAGVEASAQSSEVSLIALDPQTYVNLPDGGTYTTASGVEYPEGPGIPVPEPATLTLLGLGLTGLVGKFARRRNR